MAEISKNVAKGEETFVKLKQWWKKFSRYLALRLITPICSFASITENGACIYFGHIAFKRKTFQSNTSNMFIMCGKLISRGCDLVGRGVEEDSFWHFKKTPVINSNVLLVKHCSYFAIKINVISSRNLLSHLAIGIVKGELHARKTPRYNCNGWILRHTNVLCRQCITAF